MNEPTVTPTYISLDAAAQTLSVSVKTVRRLIAAGQLRAYRCGKRTLRVRAADVESVMTRIPTTQL